MSFINTIFLFAIGAAAIPIILHFVRRMKAKRVAFSSLMFLSESPKQLVKKRRLRDLLLMAVRASMVALLALAFARPFLPPEFVPFTSRAENESVVLLLDTSFSMWAGAAADNGAPGITSDAAVMAFAAAKAEALDRIESADASDEIAVVTFSDSPRQLTELDRDKSLHRAALGLVSEPDYRPTSFYEALRLADEILQDAQHEQRRVVLLSDLQQNGWPGSLENWKLPAGIVFEPVQFGAPTSNNAVVEDLAISMRRDPSQTEAVAIRLDARVKSDAGRRDGSDLETSAEIRANQATLEIENVGTETRAVPALASSRVSYQQRVQNAGLFTGSLSLSEDDLPVDNRYYFSFAVDERPSILSIDGGSRSTYRESFFLEKAFDLGADRLYDFESGNAGLLNRRNLAGKALVFASNLNSFSTTAVNDIRSYVEDGGVAVVSFGDRANIAAYSTALASLGIGTADRTVSPASTQGSEAIIGDVTWRHPVFSDLQGAAGGILRPKFRRYARVSADSSASIIASFDTGDPWIIEKRIGRGSLLVTTATLGSEWTNFPINELFVPFVYQLARYAVGISRDQMMYLVGDAVALSGRAGEAWNIRTPRGDVFTVELNQAATSGVSRGYFRDTDIPGQYVATNGSNRFVFSVNVDPSESNLQTRDADQVYASVVTPLSETPGAKLSTADLLATEERNQKLWRILLAVVLALFLAETFLANKPRLGRTATK